MTAKPVLHFSTMHNLIYLLGRKAKNLEELCAGIAGAPDSSLYFHTHHELHQHEVLSPEPPNDFAFWIKNVYQHPVLAERIAGLDFCSFARIWEIRAHLVELIDAALAENHFADRTVPPGMDFHFMTARTFVLPTGIEARDLKEFAAALRRVPIASIFFHMFNARLQMENGRNEFSRWLKDALGEEELAAQIGALDPYTQSMENLRSRLIRLVERRLAEVDLG